MRRNRLLEAYPSFAHIGLSQPEEEEGPPPRKDIYSTSQLRDVIDQSRDQRMEDEPLDDQDSLDLPIITLMASYRSGGATTVNYFFKPPRYEGGAGEMTAYKGNPRAFLKEKNQSLLTQTSDRMKAQNIFDRVDVGAIYPEMERRAISMLRRFKPYYHLYRRCKVLYEDTGTASIVYDRKQKRFVLRLNPTFLVYMSVMNLVDGHPKSTMSSLRQLYQDSFDVDLDTMAHTLLFVLMHEMGHIFYQHTGRRLGLYVNFDHQDVNVYGDVLINLRLTKVMMKGEVDPRMLPNIGLGKDRHLKGRTEDAKASVIKFVETLRGIVEFNYHSGPDDSVAWFKPEPATMLAIFNPAALVTLNVPTFVLLNLFKSTQETLGLDPPQPLGGSEEEPEGPEPKKVSKPLVPGQVVIIKATGEQGVVVSAGVATENPDLEGDYNQQVKIIPRSQLPEEYQKAIDEEQTRITAPPMTGPLSDPESSGSSTSNMG